MKSKQESFVDNDIAFIELHNLVWLDQYYLEKELLTLLPTSTYEELAALNKDIKLTKHEILRHTW
jgi:hypothetical protein